jgi:hypothetical protein
MRKRHPKPQPPKEELVDNFDVSALLQGAEAEQAMIESDLQSLADSLNSQPSDEVRASTQNRVTVLMERKHVLGTLIARARTFQKLGPYPTSDALSDTPEHPSSIYVMTLPEEPEE